MSCMTFFYGTRTDSIVIMHAYMFWLHIDSTSLFAHGQYWQSVTDKKFEGSLANKLLQFAI